MAAPEPPPEAPSFPRSRCPVAATLDLVGDRWTLVVVRDLLFFGKHRFADLLAGGEGISTNVLADRLARLEACGLVARRPYQAHPPRHEYHLTAMGCDMRPVLLEMIRWANRHLPGTVQAPPGLLGDPRGGKRGTPT